MLTALRGQQVGADAALGMQGFEAEAGYRDALAKARHDTDLERARALYEAAEAEEQNLVEDQLLVGRQRAKKNDYGLLGLLYGLTPDQVDKLQGTGRYAQRGSQGGYVDPLSALYGISAETADAIGSLPIPGNVSPDLHPFFRQRLNQLSRSNHVTPNQGR